MVDEPHGLVGSGASGRTMYYVPDPSRATPIRQWCDRETLDLPIWGRGVDVVALVGSGGREPSVGSGRAQFLVHCCPWASASVRNRRARFLCDATAAQLIRANSAVRVGVRTYARTMK